MHLQGLLDVVIGIACLSIPISALVMAVNKTPNHPFACPECDADVPVGSPRCPHCGHDVPDQDQAL